MSTSQYAQRWVISEYEALLIAVVKKDPRTLGLPYYDWTTTNLSYYLAQRTWIKVKVWQVENYPRARGSQLWRPALGVKHKQGSELVEGERMAL